MTQTSLTYLHPNRYSEELHYYQFTVKLDRSVGNYNTFNDWSNKVFVPSRTEDLNLSVLFNIITGMNELKSLTRHISCECKYKFDGRKCNADHCWNNDKCRCECKTSCMLKRFCLKSCYMWLWRWIIFGKYYGWFSDYVWWISNQQISYFHQLFGSKKTHFSSPKNSKQELFSH